MEPPAACIPSRIAFLAQLPKSQLSTWQLQSDLTLIKTRYCSIEILKENCVKAFEFFSSEIRKNKYKLLEDPALSMKIPAAFRRIKGFLKTVSYTELCVEELRIEIIANLPLRAVGRSFMFDAETANFYLAKRKTTIPLEVYVYLTKRVEKNRASIGEDTIRDHIRLIYLLTDCFKPFLIVLLPKEDKESTNRVVITECKNNFIPSVNRLLEIEDLTPLQANFLENIFKNQNSRIYPLILQHYQPYWMRRFNLCISPEIEVEKRLNLFYRLWCYYTPATTNDPTLDVLTVRFLKSIFFELDNVIRDERCQNALKKICLQRGITYWPLVAKQLVLEGSEDKFIEQKLLVKEGNAVKISDDWTMVIENLLSNPSEFLEELFHSYQLVNHPLLFQFTNGPSFYQYPWYFLRLARECLGDDLKILILKRIAQLDFSRHFKWEVILKLNLSFKCYDELLLLAKKNNNEVIIDICYTKLVKILKIFLRKPPLIALHIEESDFIKIVKQCDIRKSKNRVLTLDLAYFPLMTAGGLKALSEKFTDLNWVNFPFDKDSPLCDIIFECDEEKIFLNTYLLATVSEYFKSLFSNVWLLTRKVGVKNVKKMERTEFDFFKKFMFLLLTPSSNTYRSLLSYPDPKDKIKKIFQVVFEGVENPVELCFEFLGVAIYYQIYHLVDLLDQFYTFAVTTWDVKYPDVEILNMYRIKDYKIWVFKEALMVDKSKGELDVNKYLLLKHTRLFQYFKLDHLLR